MEVAPGWLALRVVISSGIHSLLQRTELRLSTTVQNQIEGADELLAG
jgi:hypothetical protein